MPTIIRTPEAKELTFEDFLTTDDLARILRLKKRTIYEYIKSMKIPAYQFGKEYRVLRSDLADFVRSNSLGKKVGVGHTVIDLFCGCGGLSYGFMQTGKYDVLLGIDHWKEALDTFLLNHHTSKTCLSDLEKINPADIAKQYALSKVDVIIGGPPCQGFSIAGKRDATDPRNGLYKSFVRFVEFFKPKAFVMENVPNLISMSNGTIKDAILSDFEKMGYKTTYKVLLGSAYGLPQNRRRVVFVGLLNGREFEFPEPTHGENLAPLVTCEEAIGDLPSDSVAEGGNYPHAAQTEYQKMMRKNSSGVFNHEITNHAEETKRIIAMVPDGGNFRSLPKKLQSTRKVNIAWTRFNSKKPSYTIDTGHFHHFHYKYNRVPTARESARLQSFPDDFIFIGNKTSKLKQVGNAVPPLLGNLLAERLLRYM